jgi:toxin HigB-1
LILVTHRVTITSVIRSFRDKDTARIFAGRRPKRIPQEILERTEAKLAVLDQAESVTELRKPPSNRLHKLSGDRAGQWAIRINAQWRICFEFDEEAGDAEAVEVSKHYE